MGVSLKTLQNGEQYRRRPAGSAAALLRIIAKQPKRAMEAIQSKSQLNPYGFSEMISFS